MGRTAVRYNSLVVLACITPILLCMHGVFADNGNQYHSLEPDQDLEYWKQDGWEKLHRVEPYKILALTFALKQRNKDALEDLLLKVSDPDSKQYGNYISVDKITQLVSPSKQSIDTVKIWLINNNVPESECELNLNRDFLVCHIPLRIAEKLLIGSHFYYFKHEKLSHMYIRSDSRYYVPAYIAKHLDFIGGIHRFPAVNFVEARTEKQKIPEYEQNLQGLHVGIYPKILREKYNLSSADVGSHPNNSQVVAQFLEQHFSQSDLSEFMALFVGNEFPHHTSIDKIIGPNGGKSGIEASLDTQYIMGLGANISTWFWSTGGRHARQEPFLRWMIDVGNTTEVPWVHSVSYGDDERSLSAAYMQRINIEFMKIGLRGITILFASGDDGAGCKKKKFNPSFPVSSPYVTGVGGTGFKNPFGVGPEFAYEISGGGFSNVFKQPKYQAAKVDAFMSVGDLPPEKYYNKTGRAYPDIAAISRHFWIVNNRIPLPGVMGTSASTPTVAGIVSMINEHRLRNNKPTMGFINPFLYKNSHALNDITSGCNEGCLAGDKGFCAVKGFDPVTGNGSPNYPELIKAAMKIFS